MGVGVRVRVNRERDDPALAPALAGFDPDFLSERQLGRGEARDFQIQVKPRQFDNFQRGLTRRHIIAHLDMNPVDRAAERGP